jgi:glycosyltransferase involved in cell wall biosynthesis
MPSIAMMLGYIDTMSQNQTAQARAIPPPVQRRRSPGTRLTVVPDEAGPIVVIAWKDITNPAAGGAELLLHELSKRLVRDGRRVLHLVPGYRGCERRSVVDGIEIVRLGRSIFSFYAASFHFLLELRRSAALVVDVFNCVGSFACLAVPRERAVLMIFHVQGPTWFLQPPIGRAPRPLRFLMTRAGYVLERLQLRLLALLHRGEVVTVSDSTRDELRSFGFSGRRISIVPCACTLQPLPSTTDSLPKEPAFTVALLGPRRVKRPMETLDGFELFQRRQPEARLWVIGWGTEAPDLERAVAGRGIPNVVFWGRVDEALKAELLQRAHVVCKSSIKEGWGIVVIEANAMATPVLAADVPGLRDALAFGNGWLYTGGAAGLAARIDELHEMWRDRPDDYERLRAAALVAARRFDFERSYAVFKHNLPFERTATAGSAAPVGQIASRGWPAGAGLEPEHPMTARSRAGVAHRNADLP